MKILHSGDGHFHVGGELGGGCSGHDHGHAGHDHSHGHNHKHSEKAKKKIDDPSLKENFLDNNLIDDHEA